MKTIIVDPFPRQMNLIFSKDKLVYLKKNFKLINAPIKNKKKFYENNISKADFIIGQPDLPNTILKKAAKLKAIFNVCLLYTSPSPRDLSTSRMPSSA